MIINQKSPDIVVKPKVITLSGFDCGMKYDAKLYWYLGFTARSLFDFLLVSGMTFNPEFDFLQTAFAQNEFGNVAILDVPKESEIRR